MFLDMYHDIHGSTMVNVQKSIKVYLQNIFNLVQKTYSSNTMVLVSKILGRIITREPMHTDDVTGRPPLL